MRRLNNVLLNLGIQISIEYEMNSLDGKIIFVKY